MWTPDGDERHEPLLVSGRCQERAQCDINLSPSPHLEHYRQSLLIPLSATLLSFLLGIPLGAWVALASFRGRGLLLTGFNVGFGLPPVVIGLLMAILLVRHGPLGGLHLRFTPTAMVLAQFVLSYPIMVNLTIAALQQLNPKLQLQMRALGASRWRPRSSDRPLGLHQTPEN